MLKLLLTTLLVFLLQEIVAQRKLLDSTRFGVKAGANFSHLAFSKGPDLSLELPETTWDTGLHFGLLMIVPLGRNFYVQPEYLYSEMGGEVRTFNSVYTINYFSMPALLRWEIAKRLAVLADPQFGLVINAHAITDGEKIKMMDDIENRHFGAILEGEYSISNSLSVGARYLQGINRVDLMYMGDRYEFKY